MLHPRSSLIPSSSSPVSPGGRHFPARFDRVLVDLPFTVSVSPKKERVRTRSLKDAKTPTSQGGSSPLFSNKGDIDWDRAAQVFVEATEKYDVDEDKLLSTQLGMDVTDPTFEKYKGKIKQKLKERAEELKKIERQQPGQELFLLGQRAYGGGNYKRAEELFTKALGESGPFNKLGGEIQLWLALSYQALGREEDCIALYKQIEAGHPMPAIKKQAADLRYIMEAPKLVISEDERVKIPVLEGLERNTARGATVVRPKPAAKKREYKMSLEEQFLENYVPPLYRVNKYVWWASGLLAVYVAWYSTSL